MDFIESFLNYTAELPSPAIFREWAAISLVGASVERRVFTANPAPMKPLFPNIYVMFVGMPGSGKSVAIDAADTLATLVEWIQRAPHGVTKARLLDVLAKSERKLLDPLTGECIEYSSLYAIIDEFSTFFTSYDAQFMAVLIRMWDNPELHGDETRHGEFKLKILNPQLNILVGTQPNYLNSVLPEEAWSTGMMARFIMVHSSKIIKRKSLWGVGKVNGAERNKLVDRIVELTKLKGAMDWTKEAQDELSEWYEADCPPSPAHPRLAHYCGRRITQVQKLAMISSLSRASLQVERTDSERAIEWLLSAERTMPGVFASMTSKSDKPILDELWRHCWDIYQVTKQGVPSSELWKFLQQRASADRIDRLIQAAVKCDLLTREALSDHYVPTTPSDHAYRSEK